MVTACACESTFGGGRGMGGNSLEFIVTGFCFFLNMFLLGRGGVCVVFDLVGMDAQIVGS